MRCLPAVHGAVVAALALLAGGCGSSPPVHYYTFATGQGAEKAAASRPAGAYTVAVGPVSVPAGVDRPQIVIQTAPNRVALVDDRRWAEPLNSAIARVIASDLSQQLGVLTVIFPQQSLADVKYRAAIEIRNFVSVPGESATIEATWTVFGPADSVRRGQALVREAATEAGYEALAAAHGRALMKISQQVAATISGAEAGH